MQQIGADEDPTHFQEEDGENSAWCVVCVTVQPSPASAKLSGTQLEGLLCVRIFVSFIAFILYIVNCGPWRCTSLSAFDFLLYPAMIQSVPSPLHSGWCKLLFSSRKRCSDRKRCTESRNGGSERLCLNPLWERITPACQIRRSK
jgi:hypothetical protein